MPCPGDSYEGRIRSELARERDAAMRAACSAGKFLSRLPQIPLDLKDDPDLLAFMQWWGEHRKRDKKLAIEAQLTKVQEIANSIGSIRDLGGEPKPRLIERWRRTKRKLRRLRASDPADVTNNMY
jgi:hypothetical protein